MGNDQNITPPKKMPVLRFQIISVLGSGSFGTVYKAWDLDDNQLYAIKKIELDPNENSEMEIIKEITILDKLQSINPKPLILPKFFGYSVETKDEKTSYLMKFELKDGNLRSLIQEKIEKKQNFSFESLRKWTISLIKGLAYLQSKNISHRDLKCENILFSYSQSMQEQDIKLTITDFGESTMQISKNDFLKTIHVRGTFANMAPELRISYFKDAPGPLNYNPYKADAFSLGISLLEIGTLKMPYNGNRQKNMDLTNIKSGNFEKELKNLLKELRESYLGKAKSDEEKKLIKNFDDILWKLLIVDEKDRADFIEVFQEINKLATTQELLGALSEEIKQESNPTSVKEISVPPKKGLNTSKSQEFISKNFSPKVDSNSSKPSDRLSFKSKNMNIPKDGCCEVVMPSRDKYFGQFLNYKKHGKGILTLVNGDIYKGDFENDEIEGNGEYLYENGDKYIGELKKGTRHGKGLFKFKNMGFYEGEWFDGFQEGYGEFYWDNGDKYRGNFSKGMMHGKGIYEYIDGRSYNGEWKNGNKEGQGVLILANGEKYTGEFKNDQFDGQGVMQFSNGKKTGGIWKNGELVEKKEECKIF